MPNAHLITSPVLDWEGLYSVTVEGNVYSHRTNKILATRLDVSGYPCVTLANGRRRRNAKVHILVCEAFHGPRPAGLLATHINGVASDSRPENLRWATPKQNMADRRDHGTHCVGERVGTAKLSVEQVIHIRAVMAARSGGKIIRDGVPRALAAEFGVHSSNIYQIARMDAWVEAQGKINPNGPTP